MKQNLYTSIKNRVVNKIASSVPQQNYDSIYDFFDRSDAKSIFDALIHKVAGKNVPHGIAELPHSFVIPSATYSPWLADKSFMQTYEIIQAHTLVDLYRCYELWTLVDFVKNVPGDFLEVGVWRGGTSALVLEKMKQTNVDATLYACDTFEGVVKTSKEDTSYTDGAHSDTSFEHVETLLNQIDDSRHKILVGIFPDDVFSQVENNTYCYVHIDVDVYQSAKDVFHSIWDKVNPGGIVVFDDYGFQGCEGITKLCNELEKSQNLSMIRNLNGHAVFVKR